MEAKAKMDNIYTNLKNKDYTQDMLEKDIEKFSKVHHG